MGQLGDQHGQAQLPLHPPGGNGLTLIGNGGIGAEVIRFFNLPAVKKHRFSANNANFSGALPAASGPPLDNFTKSAYSIYSKIFRAGCNSPPAVQSASLRADPVKLRDRQ